MQHAGNFSAAAALADEARSMDLADRYLNSECVMQMLQADQVYSIRNTTTFLHGSTDVIVKQTPANLISANTKHFTAYFVTCEGRAS